MLSLQNLKHDRRIAWIAFLVLALPLIARPFIADYAFGRTWVRILAFVLLYVMLALELNIVVAWRAGGRASMIFAETRSPPVEPIAAGLR